MPLLRICSKAVVYNPMSHRIVIVVERVSSVASMGPSSGQMWQCVKRASRPHAKKEVATGMILCQYRPRSLRMKQATRSVASMSAICGFIVVMKLRKIEQGDGRSELM
jgi:hypothetical protein